MKILIGHQAFGMIGSIDDRDGSTTGELDLLSANLFRKQQQRVLIAGHRAVVVVLRSDGVVALVMATESHVRDGRGTAFPNA